MTSDHARDGAERTPEPRRGPQIHPAGGVAEPLPAPPGGALLGVGLLAHPDLPRRGNEPVRAALLQRLQRSHGNRAVQRFMQRAAPVAGVAPLTPVAAVQAPVPPAPAAQADRRTTGDTSAPAPAAPPKGRALPAQERRSNGVTPLQRLAPPDRPRAPAAPLDAKATTVQRAPDPAPAAGATPPPGPAPPTPAHDPAPTPDLANVKVTMGPVRDPGSPAGMKNRIPPGKDFAVTVTLTGWDTPMAPVTLRIDGNGAGGHVTINGAETLDITTATTVQLRGTAQTPIGGGPALALVAELGGQRLAAGPGFAVSAIPENYTDTLVREIDTKAQHGFKVQDGWSSDSGNTGDLDGAEIAEVVEYGGATGAFTLGGKNSGYLPAQTFTTDTHVSSSRTLTEPGTLTANQTCKFKDNRSGSVDVPMKASGFVITRVVEKGTIWGLNFKMSKRGAATAAQGVASGAGAGSIAVEQWV
jgi:hypothetical protein